MRVFLLFLIFFTSKGYGQDFLTRSKIIDVFSDYVDYECWEDIPCISYSRSELERRVLSRLLKQGTTDILQSSSFHFLLNRTFDFSLKTQEEEIKKDEVLYAESLEKEEVEKWQWNPYLRLGWYDIEKIDPYIQFREDSIGYLGIANFPNPLDPFWEIEIPIKKGKVIFHYNEILKVIWTKDSWLLQVDQHQQIKVSFQRSW